MAGEDEEALIELRARVADSLQPDDAVEELLIEDVVARAWEARKWRRSRGAFLTSRLQQGLNVALEASLHAPADAGSLGASELSGLVAGACCGDRTAIDRVDQLLASSGVSFAKLTDLVQVGDSEVLGIVGDIERQIYVADCRRDAALDLLFRYRERRREHARHKAIEIRSFDRTATTAKEDRPRMSPKTK
jgi:hypothetical protein